MEGWEMEGVHRPFTHTHTHTLIKNSAFVLPLSTAGGEATAKKLALAPGAWGFSCSLCKCVSGEGVRKCVAGSLALSSMRLI